MYKINNIDFDLSIPEYVRRTSLGKDSELTRKLMDQQNFLLRSAVPVLLLPHNIPYSNGIKGKLPEPIGSGFVLTVKDRFFFVTAAHVLDEKKNGDVCIFIDNEYKSLTSYDGHYATTQGSPIDRHDDRYDFGFTELGSQIGKRIMQNGISVVQFGNCIQSEETFKWYSFTGWPIHWAKLDRTQKLIIAEPLIYTTRLQAEDVSHSNDNDYVHHLHLSFKDSQNMNSGPTLNL